MRESCSDASLKVVQFCAVQVLFRCFSESGSPGSPLVGRSACHSPPSARESAVEPVHFPEKPRPNDRAYGARDARHELVGDHAGGTRGAVAKWDNALREVTTFVSFLWVCVNDCG